jgi:hypothetical protein
MSLTPSDRSSLIRLASSLPVGDTKRKAILAGLNRSANLSRSVLEADPTAQVEEMQDIGVVVIRYVSPQGRLAAAMYTRRSDKPVWVYVFKSDRAREIYIQSQVDAVTKAVQERKERAQAKKEFQHNLQVGDILVSSWGYDQTNINFYEVVGVTSKQVALRKVEKKVVGGGGSTHNRVVPLPGRFQPGPILKKTPRKNGMGGGAYVKITSSETAYLWDGKPESETAAGYGH